MGAPVRPRDSPRVRRCLGVRRAMSQDRLDRTHLPIPDPQWVGVTTYDAKDPDTQFPPITPIRPPDGAPNVLVILIDDAGFGVEQRLRWPVHHADLRAARG